MNIVAKKVKSNYPIKLMIENTSDMGVTAELFGAYTNYCLLNHGNPKIIDISSEVDGVSYTHLLGMVQASPFVCRNSTIKIISGRHIMNPGLDKIIVKGYHKYIDREGGLKRKYEYMQSKENPYTYNCDTPIKIDGLTSLMIGLPPKYVILFECQK